MRVSAELIEILGKADQWRTMRTGKAFDPAAQEVIEKLIQEGIAQPRAFEERHGPLWTVNSAASTACLLTESSISLNAIAKGYIVAQAAARGAGVDGVEDVLLNVGGDIQHYGAHATVAGVADPFAPEENGPAIGAVRIQNSALATSSGIPPRICHQRPAGVAHRRSTHRTPVDHIASASVFAPDCATANALRDLIQRHAAGAERGARGCPVERRLYAGREGWRDNHERRVDGPRGLHQSATGRMTNRNSTHQSGGAARWSDSPASRSPSPD